MANQGFNAGIEFAAKAIEGEEDHLPQDLTPKQKLFMIDMLREVADGLRSIVNLKNG
jgi:hypothetical protein